MISSKTALEIFQTAIKSVTPEMLFKNKVRFHNQTLYVHQEQYPFNRYRYIYIIGAGKASAHMALSLENQIGEYITDGAIITKYGHTTACKKVKIYEAGHPVPDQNTLTYSRKIIDLVQKASKNDLVICLFSGGGSALMEMLPERITLNMLQSLNRLLLKSGADINEINSVRKQISLIKGGKLATKIYPASGFSLIISDVLNDHLESIASGPTVPESSSFDQAWHVFEKYHLQEQVDPEIIEFFKHGRQEESSKKNKQGDSEQNKFHNYIIGNNIVALESAHQKAQSKGFKTHLIKADFQGEARIVSEEIVKVMQNHKISEYPQCLLFGGESTVKVTGKGKGGRNQELALSMLIGLEKFKHPFVVLSAGTDGTDGPTDAAGALFDNETWNLLKKKKLDANAYLKNNDSYHFFEQVNGLVKTGPTGTNVMDIVIVLFNNSEPR